MDISAFSLVQTLLLSKFGHSVNRPLYKAISVHAINTELPHGKKGRTGRVSMERGAAGRPAQQTTFEAPLPFPSLPRWKLAGCTNPACRGSGIRTQIVLFLRRGRGSIAFSSNSSTVCCKKNQMFCLVTLYSQNRVIR